MTTKSGHAECAGMQLIRCLTHWMDKQLRSSNFPFITGIELNFSEFCFSTLNEAIYSTGEVFKDCMSRQM